MREATPSCSFATADSGGVQREWAQRGLAARLNIMRSARHRLAGQATELAAAISPALARSTADTLTAEVLPLLDAMKFLEREAGKILATRKLGSSGRPFWLSGVRAEIQRVPFGSVLVIGPANFPLFLPGVQVLQALVAGNAVVWKPGTGGANVAAMVAASLEHAGLPPGLLRVTDESISAAEQELLRGADKVVFTGSAENGGSILAKLAETATPAVMELSGADAVFVMPGADLRLVARAVAFGLRLNGGAVCMSPRRLLARKTTLLELRPLLEAELAKIDGVKLQERVASRLSTLLADAAAQGAEITGLVDASAQRPIVVTNVSPQAGIARADIFAPVICLMEAGSMIEAIALYAACPYALTASIFCARGEEKKARTLAAEIKAGTVVINDLIAPTADARLPFGGRGASGFGTTRGAEGLLEMTAVKTVIARRGGAMRHLDATTNDDTPLFAALIQATHAGGFAARWAGLKEVIRTGRARQQK